MTKEPPIYPPLKDAINGLLTHTEPNGTIWVRKDDVLACIEVRSSGYSETRTIHEIISDHIKLKGYTGICSAHRDGENPDCKTCYPEQQRGYSDYAEGEVVAEKAQPYRPIPPSSAPDKTSEISDIEEDIRCALLDTLFDALNAFPDVDGGGDYILINNIMEAIRPHLRTTEPAPVQGETSVEATGQPIGGELQLIKDIHAGKIVFGTYLFEGACLQIATALRTPKPVSVSLEEGAKALYGDRAGHGLDETKKFLSWDKQRPEFKESYRILAKQCAEAWGLKYVD